VARRKELLDEVGKSIENKVEGATVLVVAADLATADPKKDVVDKVVAKFGRIL